MGFVSWGIKMRSPACLATHGSPTTTGVLCNDSVLAFASAWIKRCLSPLLGLYLLLGFTTPGQAAEPSAWKEWQKNGIFYRLEARGDVSCYSENGVDCISGSPQAELQKPVVCKAEQYDQPDHWCNTVFANLFAVWKNYSDVGSPRLQTTNPKGDVMCLSLDGANCASRGLGASEMFSLVTDSSGCMLKNRFNPAGRVACAGGGGVALRSQERAFIAGLNQQLNVVVCGKAHKAVWGVTGYDVPGHWCNALKASPWVLWGERYVRLESDGQFSCYSENGRNCSTGAPSAQSSDWRPLVCGEPHRLLYSVTGYETPGHWCNTAYANVFANWYNYDVFDQPILMAAAPTGDLMCLSTDGKNCRWRADYARKSPPADIDIVPVICGAMHRQLYGVTGYKTKGHWCSLPEIVYLSEKIPAPTGFDAHIASYTLPIPPWKVQDQLRWSLYVSLPQSNPISISQPLVASKNGQMFAEPARFRLGESQLGIKFPGKAEQGFLIHSELPFTRPTVMTFGAEINPQGKASAYGVAGQRIQLTKVFDDFLADNLSTEKRIEWPVLSADVASNRLNNHAGAELWMDISMYNDSVPSIGVFRMLVTKAHPEHFN